MLILVPIILIVIALYVIDALYFEDMKPKSTQNQNVISKESNVSSQKYLDKYLKK